jgi:hypothetical protein
MAFWFAGKAAASCPAVPPSASDRAAAWPPMETTSRIAAGGRGHQLGDLMPVNAVGG